MALDGKSFLRVGEKTLILSSVELFKNINSKVI